MLCLRFHRCRRGSAFDWHSEWRFLISHLGFFRNERGSVVIRGLGALGARIHPQQILAIDRSRPSAMTPGVVLKTTPAV